MESRLKAEYSTIELATLIKFINYKLNKEGCVYPITIKTIKKINNKNGIV